MAYKVPTLEQMLGILTALFKALLPTRNVGSRFSFYWKLLKTFAGGVTDVHAHVDAAGKDSMPDTARGAAQDRWLKIVGTARKGATGARKANALRLTGSVGSAFTTGAQLRHDSTGLIFQITESGTIPVATFIDVDVSAVDVGSATRLKAGETLKFLSPPPGIATTAELQLDLDEDGYDQELDGAANVRLLALLGTPSSGGNQADFVKWCLAQLGINAAYCYPNRAGIGSVDVAALHSGTGSARFLTIGERNVLLAALQLLAPSQVGGSGGALRVLDTIGETANVEVTVTPNGDAAYAFNWDDTAPPIVLSWNAGTRLLTFTGARPATMKAGDQLCIRGVASVQDSAPITIESLSGTDAVVLQSVPKKPDGTDATPAATDQVYSGGPLVSRVRDAIIAHINSDVLYAYDGYALPAGIAVANSISTARLKVLLDGIGTANPAAKYGTWSGALRRQAIATIAAYTRGVYQHVTITPAVDQEATDYAFPNDAQIGMLSVGSVLVRRG